MDNNENVKKLIRTSFIQQNRKAIKLQEKLKKEHIELFRKEMEKKSGKKLDAPIEMSKEVAAHQQL